MVFVQSYSFKTELSHGNEFFLQGHWLGILSLTWYKPICDWSDCLYINLHASLFTSDTAKPCHGATNGEEEACLFRWLLFSTTLCWLWGKSPDTRQKVPVAKTPVFFVAHSGEEARWRSHEGWRRRFVQAKSCKVISTSRWELDGAYYRCVPQFFTFTKVDDINACSLCVFYCLNILVSVEFAWPRGLG